MKNSLYKFHFSLFLATFLSIWISDGFYVIIENDKYVFSKTIEDSDTENKTENLSNTEFINETNFLEFTNFCFLNTPENNLFYLFKIKDFFFENKTPPPEIA
jgi:hypothetical protein